MIEVVDLHKSYGKHQALRGISFGVGKGEVVGFLGPNGAGKSTTMKILTGLIPPSAGEARVAGSDVLENPLEVRRHLGYLPEVPPLYNEMAVSTFLRFVAELRGVSGRERKTAVDEVIERCGLQEVERRPIRQLSKGYRQRVGIAQAVVHRPELIILDEPTSGLDPRQVVDIRTIIRTLGDSCTVFLSSHILPEVTATCDRVIIVNRGRVVAEGGITELTGGAGERLLLVLGRADAAAPDALSALPGVEGIEGDEDPRRLTVRTDGSREARVALAAAVIERGWGLEELSPQRSSLEEVFLRLVAKDEGLS